MESFHYVKYENFPERVTAKIDSLTLHNISAPFVEMVGSVL